MAKTWTLSALAAAALTLAACGGGGDSTDTSGGSNTPTTPTTPTTPAYAGWQREVPEPAYATGSPQRIAFDYLNKQLSHCGFGKMKHNAALDVAALGHAKWVGFNRQFGHYQTTGTTFFTGVSPEDRMVAAGYALRSEVGIGGEVLSDKGIDLFGSNKNRPELNKLGVMELFNAPYHGGAMLWGGRDVGFFVGSKSEAAGVIPAGTATAHETFINYSYLKSEGSQNLNMASTDVMTYPCEGSTEVGYIMSSEIPNPVPGRRLYAEPLGTSIQIIVRPGQTLKVTSATMIEANTEASVPMRAAVDSTNDPHGRYSANQAYVAADVPTKPGTKYQVTLNGTNNGAVFSRTFSFTTMPCSGLPTGTLTCK